MLLLPVLLTLGFLLLSAGGLSVVLIHVRQARRELETHVALVVGGAARRAETKLEVPVTGWQVQVATWMRRWFAFGLPRTWAMRAGPLTLGLIAVAGAMSAWFFVRIGLHFSVPISLAATLAGFFLLPRTWLNREQKAAEQQFQALFPETIDMVIRMLRAGMPVTAAVRSVGTESAPPVNGVFEHIADQMAIGITFEDALAAAGERVGLPDFRFFVVAISLQRATGGNLAVTLDILSDIMRKRRAMRLKAKAVTGEVRMSAYILGAMPFMVIGGLLVVSPNYLRPLITDPRGNIIVGIAVGSMSLGFLAIRQMMRSVTRG